MFMGVVEKRVSSKGVASYRAKVRLRGLQQQIKRTQNR